MPTVKTETNVETLNVKASDLLLLQSVNGPNTTTSLGYYNNKILNIVGTLDQILAVKQSFTAYGLYAKPSNVIGCSAEYKEGIGWVGCLGSFASVAEFQASVPVTSDVGFGQAWAIINGLVQVVGQGFTLLNSALQTSSDGLAVASTLPVVAPALGKRQAHTRSRGQIVRDRISANFSSTNLTANASGETWLLVFEAPDPTTFAFEVVMPTVVAGSGTTPNIFAAKAVGSIADAKAIASLTGLNGTIGASPFQASFAALQTGLSSVTSNPYRLEPVVRNDGGTLPLYAVFVGFAANAPRTLVDYPSVTSNPTALAAWQNGDADHRILASYHINGAGVGSWPLATCQFPILGINWYVQKPVVNVGRVGDSILDGAGNSVRLRDGFVAPSLRRLQAKYPGVVFGDTNLSMPGASNTVFHQMITSYLAAQPLEAPDIIVTENASTNEVVSSAATSLTNYTNHKYQQTLAVNAARKLGIRVLGCNIPPCTTAVKDLTASDYVRLQINAEQVAITDIDLSGPVSGATVNGQVQPISGAMSDGMHPSDATNATYSLQLDTYLLPSID